MIVLYIILGLLVLIALLFWAGYNSFVKLNNKTKEAFATMDVYLKKRWDLIPNLVEAIKGFAKHEKDLLQSVVQLRNTNYESLGQNEKISKNAELSNGLNKLFAIAEAYPELKSNENFRDLNTQLANIESEIAQSRKYYNAVVRDYNNKVQMFPSRIVAKMFGYKTQAMFETDQEERKNVKVQF